MANKPANTQTTGKRGGKTSTSWKKGDPSPNPAGRPPDGESWAGVLRWAAELTGAEAADISPPELAREFRKLGKLKLKHAVTLRTFAAMLFDPSAGLFNAMMDRAEGKVAQPVELTWREEAQAAGLSPELLDQMAEELFQKAVSKTDPTNAGDAAE